MDWLNFSAIIAIVIPCLTGFGWMAKTLWRIDKHQGILEANQKGIKEDIVELKDEVKEHNNFNRRLSMLEGKNAI